MMRCAVYIQLIYVLRAICTQSVVIYYVPITVLSPCFVEGSANEEVSGRC